MQILDEATRGDVAKVKTANEDNLLLKRIGTQRDRVAFEELYTKHKRKAYSLALHITGKQHLAEEAVQDAMLVVWLQADRFIPGNGRAWLLSVVAHKCLQLARKKYRKDVPLGLDQQLIRDRKGSSIEEDCSESEATSKLREMVSKLPASERSLLAMYFTGELSQDQISKLTQTPQRTVSTKLKRILEKLRTGMLQAGLASAALLPETVTNVSEGIDGNFFELMEPATELGVRLMQSLDQPSLSSASGKGDPSFKFAFRTVGCAFLIILLVGAWQLNKANPETAATEPATQTGLIPAWKNNEVQEENRSFPIPTERPFHYKWSFENGPLNDVFPIIKGQWRGWRPAKGKRPAARLAPIGLPDAVGIVLPLTFPKSNFRIRVRAEMSKKPGLVAGLAFCWVDYKNPPASYRQYTNSYSVSVGSHLELEFLVKGSCYVNLVNKRLTGLREFNKDYPRRWLAMVAHGIAIQAIEIDELVGNQFPAAYRDPAVLFSKATKEAGWNMEERFQTLVSNGKK